MTALAVIEREKIISRVANGDMLTSIASDLGIAPPNISKHLANDPEYKAARELGAQTRLESAYEALANAETDGLREGKYGQEVDGNLVRARAEKWRASAWFAEREFPNRWGAKQQIEHSGAILQVDGDMLKAAGDLLGLVREREIQSEPPQVPDSTGTDAQ